MRYALLLHFAAQRARIRIARNIAQLAARNIALQVCTRGAAPRFVLYYAKCYVLCVRVGHIAKIQNKSGPHNFVIFVNFACVACGAALY